MTEVRRHQRTVDGKTVNVKHHTRSGTTTAAEKRQDAWEDRAAERWTPPPRPESGDAEPAEESWWDEDNPRPEAWHDTGGDEVEYGGHTFKVNRAPAYRPQGDYDFRYPERD